MRTHAGPPDRCAFFSFFFVVLVSSHPELMGDLMMINLEGAG